MLYLYLTLCIHLCFCLNSCHLCRILKHTQGRCLASDHAFVQHCRTCNQWCHLVTLFHLKRKTEINVAWHVLGSSNSSMTTVYCGTLSINIRKHEYIIIFIQECYTGDYKVQPRYHAPFNYSSYLSSDATSYGWLKASW